MDSHSNHSSLVQKGLTSGVPCAMKTSEQKRKATKRSSRKEKTTDPGLSCTKFGISPHKGAKQRRKTSGSKTVSLQLEQSGQIENNEVVFEPMSPGWLPDQWFETKGENSKEFSEQCLLGPTPPLSPEIPTSAPRQASLCFQKFKLQLFPIDEATHKGLEMEKHNPFLELTIGTRKKISSVVKHLNIKWGKSRVASGELLLFPFYTQPNNLTSHLKWTSKDSGITAADVHAAVGSPSIFRLRYGWFSEVRSKFSRMPLVPSFSESALQISGTQKRNTGDDEKPSCSIAGNGHGSACSDNLLNQDACNTSQLGKTVEEKDYNRTNGSSTLLWDLSNISFGAFLHRDTKSIDASLINFDSFDAAIARYKATIQSSPLSQPSIFDAEVTCNAFCFQKTLSSSGSLPAQSQDVSAASGMQYVSSNSTMLRNVIQMNSQAGPIEDNACEQPKFGLELSRTGEASLHPEVASDHVKDVSERHNSHPHTEASLSESSHLGKLDINWTGSLGHLEYAAAAEPSSKQLVGGDSIGLGGLIASSLDAFQNFSIF